MLIYKSNNSSIIFKKSLIFLNGFLHLINLFLIVSFMHIMFWSFQMLQQPVNQESNNNSKLDNSKSLIELFILVR